MKVFKGLLALSISLFAQLAAAQTTWGPTAQSVFQLAETQFPQLFPLPGVDRTQGGITSRYYAKTGNSVGVGGDTVYLASPGTGDVLRPALKMAQMRCLINPSCDLQPALLREIAPAPPSTLRPASYVAGVAVTLEPMAPISGNYVQGDNLPEATLVARASGNLLTLSGRAVYVLVVDPHGLFETQPVVSLGGASASSASLTIRLKGKKLSTPGVYHGSLQVYGCLDASCSVQFAGAPFIVPYDLSIWPAPAVQGLSTDRMPEVALPFGQSETRRYAVTLPPYTTSWSATVISSASNPTMDLFANGETNIATGSDTSAMGNATGMVTVRFRPASPGYYGVTLRVQGTMELQGRTVRFSRDFPFSYVVTATAAPDFAFSPSETVVYCKASECWQSRYWHIAAGNEGATLVRDGFEYTSPRLAAGDSACEVAWWEEVLYNGARARPYFQGRCHNINDPVLPPGTYTGRVRYKLTRDHVTRYVYHPVTLVLVP